MRARLSLTERMWTSLLGMLVALLVWLLVILGTGVIYRPDPACAVSSCSAASLIGRNPYCLIDPTCASPFLKEGYDTKARFVASWQGAAWLANFGDPTWIVGPDNLVETFSILNFVLFVAVYVAALAVVAALKGDTIRQLAATFCVTWYLLEVARWFGTYLALSNRYGFSTFSDLLTYAVIAGVLIPVVATGWWYRRTCAR